MLKLLTVLGLGAVELWAAVPAGFGIGLAPVVTVVTAALGALLGVMVVAALGERLRKRLVRPSGGRARGAAHILARYGTVGLGLLAPLLVGAPLGTALGLALGAPRGRLVVWMSIGVVVWSSLLTLATALGLAGLHSAL